jgi:hypothetical protein
MSELYNRKTDYTFTGGDAFLVQQGPLPLLKKKKKRSNFSNGPYPTAHLFSDFSNVLAPPHFPCFSFWP